MHLILLASLDVPVCLQICRCLNLNGHPGMSTENCYIKYLLEEFFGVE